MAKRSNRTETGVALLAGGIALLVAAVVGLFAYMSFTAARLQSDAPAVPSTAGFEPSRISYADTFGPALRIAEEFVHRT